MKTLLVTFDYPPMIGGIATLFGTLWPRAADAETLVLAPRGRGDRCFDAAFPGRAIRFPTVGGRGRAAKTVNMVTCALWFAGVVLRHRPERVIAGQIRRAGPLAHAWSRVTGKPFGVWVYGGETSLDFTASRGVTRYLRRLVHAARWVFTISPYTTRMMVDFGTPSQRVVEITLGVDPSLRPEPKSAELIFRHGLADKLVFVTVGRLVERKGIDTMIEALAGLGDRLPPWHYLVVSDGPYRATLEALAHRLGVTGAVTFTGFVRADELRAYYNVCDVFAMPNREARGRRGASLSVEGFGMVLVDAAACGKPVIAGRSGGAVDAVDDGVNGILVAPGDVADLQRAILELLDPERRAAMGRAGIALATRYDWDESAAKLRPFLSTDPPPWRGRT